MATTASVYNVSRTARQILKRHRKDKPSLILHLHNNHFCFERQNGMFLFDSPVKAFLQFIRDQKVPADLIDVLTDAGVQFFEGCLLAEIHDHRSHSVSTNSTLPPSHLTSLANTTSSNQYSAVADPSSSLRKSSSSLFYLQEGGKYGIRNLLSAAGPSNINGMDGKHGGINGGVEIYRIVLHPTAETLWADLKMLDDITGGVWSDQDALEVEAKILCLTSPPLCLTPDPQATRIANLMLSSTAPPSAYAASSSSPLPFHRNASKKRGVNSIEMEKEELNRQRREKIMRMMEGGLRALPKIKPPESSLAAASLVLIPPSTASSNAFVPAFGRMTFIEKWRTGKMAIHQGGLPPGAQPPPTALAGKEETNKPVADKAEENNTATAKKPPPKKKKKSQKEKEEAEVAAAAATAEVKIKEEEKREIAPKGKKKKAQLVKEEKERKEREEKETLEREEREKKAAEAAAAVAAASATSTTKTKPKSKKKQKEEAAAAAATAAAASNVQSNVASGGAISPSKGNTVNGDASVDNKSLANGATASTKSSPAKKTSQKKPPATKNPKKAPTGKNATTDGASPTKSVKAGEGGQSGSVQSTPILQHQQIPSQQHSQHQQHLFMQQQQQQQQQQQHQQQAPGTPFGGFGMPMMNGGQLGYPNGMAAAMGIVPGINGMQQGSGPGAMGMGGLLLPGQNPGVANPNSTSPNGFNIGLNGFTTNGTVSQTSHPPGTAGQPIPGIPTNTIMNGSQNPNDLPVGVGLSGLGGWGSST